MSAVVAALHLRAWYQNATEWARRSGLDLLTANERFKPPGAWWLWALLMAVAAVGALGAALLGTRRAPSAGAGPAEATAAIEPV